MKAAAASQTPSAIARVPRENGASPAAFVQERLWGLQHALPELPFFNVLYALRVTSPCDAAVLERSINEIVRRHEILRTTFAAVDGRCAQVIAPQLIVPLAFDDLRALSRMQMETTVHELIKKSCFICSILERGPLIRTHLVRLAERTHLLLIAMAGAIRTAGRSAFSSRNSPLSTTPLLPERHRRFARSRFNTPTSQAGSGAGSRILTSLHSSPIGKSSCASRYR